MIGTLYIVATPIGNLDDITLRALQVLKDVDYVFAEDTRKTSIITKHYDIQTNILIYHQHSSDSVKYDILTKLISGKNIALVTDAGTPGISDPGNELISFLLKKESSINIVPIPGPSAIAAALSVSGFKTNNFVFVGFMPKKRKSKLFAWLREGNMSFAFYESPFRIVKTLKLVQQEFGNVDVVVAREITKIYETIYRGKVFEILDEIANSKIKGEIVVIVDLSSST